MFENLKQHFYNAPDHKVGANAPLESQPKEININITYMFPDASTILGNKELLKVISAGDFPKVIEKVCKALAQYLSEINPDTGSKRRLDAIRIIGCWSLALMNDTVQGNSEYLASKEYVMKIFNAIVNQMKPEGKGILEQISIAYDNTFKK